MSPLAVVLSGLVAVARGSRVELFTTISVAAIVEANVGQIGVQSCVPRYAHFCKLSRKVHPSWHCFPFNFPF